MLAAVLGVGATAGSMAGPSPADVSAVQSFKLTPQFLHNYEAYDEATVQKPCELSPLIALSKSKGAQSLDAMIASFDAQPGVHEALKRNGLTAREMILGMTVLLGAAAQEIAAQHPEMAQNGQIKSQVPLSPENLAFYQQHKEEIRRHSTELARAQLKANGGQLPACLTGGG
jgi:hypothetical protein